MTPQDFFKTIYYGDRACKGISIDAWNRIVRIHIDQISRIRDASGEWRYYDAEDIIDGSLCFGGVTEYKCDPSGPLPNDAILAMSSTAANTSSPATFIFSCEIQSVSDDGTRTPVHITIIGTSVWLENPLAPETRITE